ncbi:hypothetical protein BV898_15627 [Hypsibius exemplaris]|uniref:G-protein coupled receptors family 1 profile domain-containing protein n=1 Tax=Hypsibius exemplaris TaxID=2072580 RepID=A0A9X6NBY2_HYPEX|nr:hypothetical protein BV898_15627 [Hypsibius exemplaris]
MNLSTTPNSTHSSNETVAPVANWTIVPVFTLVTFILGLFGNGSLLFLFFMKRPLRTPFNIYLINLLFSNCAWTLIQYPLDLVSNLYSEWYLGESACTLYLYGTGILQAAVLNAHQLIAINRVWAAVAPISYRSIHTHRTAFFVCLGGWVYTHLTTAPAWIMDSLYYRQPVDTTHSCRMNGKSQQIYMAIITLFIFDTPPLLMIIALIVTCASFCKRRRKQNTLHPTTTSAAIGSHHQPSSAPIRRKKSHNNHLLVLIFLTISVNGCWTPLNVYFTLSLFGKRFEGAAFFRAGNVLFSCQTMLDPILFALALSRIRKELGKCLFSRMRAAACVHP